MIDPYTKVIAESTQRWYLHRQGELSRHIHFGFMVALDRPHHTVDMHRRCYLVAI